MLFRPLEIQPSVGTSHQQLNLSDLEELRLRVPVVELNLIDSRRDFEGIGCEVLNPEYPMFISLITADVQTQKPR